MKQKKLSPETAVMTAGYNPEDSLMAINCPIYESSTYIFKTAEDGEEFFAVAYGKKEPEPGQRQGYIYARIDNPNLTLVEKKMSVLESSAETCAFFATGMAAIFSTIVTFVKPGKFILASDTQYGGTNHLLREILPEDNNVKTIFFNALMGKDEVIALVNESGISEDLSLIFIETPANPTNCLFDIGMAREVAEHFSTEERKVMVVVDNTLLGSQSQHPLDLGAHLVLYSNTKFDNGLCTVTAGSVLGPVDLIYKIKGRRPFHGNVGSPTTASEVAKNLKTLKIRMDRHEFCATRVAEYLKQSDMVQDFSYLGEVKPEDGKQYEIKQKQCLRNGSLMSFNVRGGKKAAYLFLNSFNTIILAVSLGGVETLAEAPYSMTHADVPDDVKRNLGILENTVRLSIGNEDPEDIIADIDQAFLRVKKELNLD